MGPVSTLALVGGVRVQRKRRGFPHDHVLACLLAGRIQDLQNPYVRAKGVNIIWQPSSDVHGIFVSGRQHSGNTVLCQILGNHSDCFSDPEENTYFEHLDRIENATRPSRKIERCLQYMLRTPIPERDLVESDLLEWYQNRPQTSAAELFEKGMTLVCKHRGKKFWALKATSYIFYAKEILTSLPHVHVLYLLRNPLDVSSSFYTRSQLTRTPKDWLYSTALGWRKGLSMARKLASQHPERFHILRYETMVSDDEALPRLLPKLGVEFDPSLLEVGYTNRADRPHEELDDESGLDPSRIFRFRTVLSESQKLAIWSLIPPSEINDFYPNLSPPDNPDWMHRLGSLIHKMRSILTLIRWWTRRFWSDPAYALRRFLRRLNIILRKNSNRSETPVKNPTLNDPME